jgi:Sigma-70 region 2
MPTGLFARTRSIDAAAERKSIGPCHAAPQQVARSDWRSYRARRTRRPPSSLAHHYHGGADADDLLQVASLGVLKAIDRFDPERGIASRVLPSPPSSESSSAISATLAGPSGCRVMSKSSSCAWTPSAKR